MSSEIGSLRLKKPCVTIDGISDALSCVVVQCVQRAPPQVLDIKRAVAVEAGS